LVYGLGFPILLLVIFANIPAFRKANASLGGLSYLSIYVPVLIAFSLAMLALVCLTTPLAAYREQGVLRRLSTTPAPPSWVLAAQSIVNLAIAGVAFCLIVIIAGAAFGVEAPKQVPGFILSVVLTTAALFAIGLWVAAIAPSAQAAGAIGSALFFPMMFFAGLWVPRNVMPPVLRDISDYTPLGAAMEALQSSTQGEFPPARALLVLVGYAIVAGVAAVKQFRWE
jgi:ABC-2 type transport system permease protein